MKYRLALFGAVLACCGCALPFKYNLPPSEQIMHPGPGVDGPGPGVMIYSPPPPPPLIQTSQVAFVAPEGMMVSWDMSAAGHFDSEPLVVPGRFNFPQGSIYRLKLTNVPGRPGVELYPTLEIGPATPRTDAYLAHNAIPFQLTEEDFDQVLTGNFVTKVIYLPDAQFQELALAGVETLVSTRLDPGVDPIVEADRRGTILAIIRVGNKDLEVPNADMGVGGDAVPADGTAPGAAAGGVMQTGYCPPGAPAACPPGFIAGATAPQYGMPITGTPIGLPGPPHVPLGVPAGLQKHVIKNHTFHHIPGPTPKVKIHVKQSPGLTYPKPASRAFIHEHARSPWGRFHQPLSSKFQAIGTECEPAPMGHGPVMATDCP
jgi:hypothetical protein